MPGGTAATAAPAPAPAPLADEELAAGAEAAAGAAEALEGVVASPGRLATGRPKACAASSRWVLSESASSRGASAPLLVPRGIRRGMGRAYYLMSRKEGDRRRRIGGRRENDADIIISRRRPRSLKNCSKNLGRAERRGVHRPRVQAERLGLQRVHELCEVHLSY